MNTSMSFLLVLIIALPVLAVATVCASGSSLSAARSGGYLNGLAFLLAAALLFWVSTQGNVSATVGSDGTLAGFHADRLVAVLLMLVTGLSAVVQIFAGRYLQGDLRSKRFFVGANLLTAATAAMVASVTVLGLGLAWTASGLALLLLLGMYPGLLPAEAG